MIDLVDDALEAWLTDALDGVSIGFEPPASAKAGKAKLALCFLLRAMREKDKARGGYVEDVRDAQDLVTARQRPVRWYTLNYVVVGVGDARQQHQALAALLQVLVDHDAVPDRFTPEVLTNRALRIEVETGDSTTNDEPDLTKTHATLRLLVTTPIVPTPNTEVGPPVTELDIEMEKHPADSPAAPTTGAAAVPDHISRRWTAVRTREFQGAIPAKAAAPAKSTKKK